MIVVEECHGKVCAHNTERGLSLIHISLYPVEGSHEPITRIDAALASEKPVEQIRAKCNIPTIALTVRVTPLRAQTLSTAPLPPASGADSESNDKVAPPEGGPADSAAGVTSGATSGFTSGVTGKDAASAGEPALASAAPTGPDNLLRVDAERIDSCLLYTSRCV